MLSKFIYSVTFEYDTQLTSDHGIDLNIIFKISGDGTVTHIPFSLP